MNRPDEVLQAVLEHGLPANLELSCYNDAVSLLARLTRYLRAAHEAKLTQYENLDVQLVKPRSLRFEYSTQDERIVKLFKG